MLVDTNVLLDLVTNDPQWADWSIRHLDAASLRGELVINDAIYAVLSLRFAAIETLEDALDEARVSVAAMPRAALFRAGKAFQRYRAAGGTQTGVLADFFIGVHASVRGLALLTRDP